MDNQADSIEIDLPDGISVNGFKDEMIVMLKRRIRDWEDHNKEARGMGEEPDESMEEALRELKKQMDDMEVEL